MKVLFITDYEVNNPAARSGVPFYITKGLKEAGIDFEVLQVTDRRTIWQRLQSRAKQWLCKAGLRKGFYDAAYSRHTALSYQKCWKGVDFSLYDRVFSISPRTVAYLPEGVKPVLWIDNTLASFRLYPEMQGISKLSFQEGLAVEQTAFERSQKIVTASGWLKAELVKQYPFAATKTFVVPRGANLPIWPAQQEVESFFPAKMNAPALHLLHVVSGGWTNDRKGTRLVLQVYRLLKTRMPVRLTIMGHIPPTETELLENEGITLAGRLNKETTSGYDLWKNLVASAHYLFVPSKADGFGIVYAEAASFGLPSLALTVMGVTEAVQQGITGWLLPAETPAGQWADYIVEQWNHPRDYEKLCHTTRQYAAEHFTWSRNLREVLGLI